MLVVELWPPPTWCHNFIQACTNASHADASHADDSYADASHADASHADASHADARSKYTTETTKAYPAHQRIHKFSVICEFM